jgi:hypothetical protein
LPGAIPVDALMCRLCPDMVRPEHHLKGAQAARFMLQFYALSAT